MVTLTQAVHRHPASCEQCGAPLPSPRPAPQRFCAECGHARNRLSDAATQRRYRRAVLGRRCQWCGRTDAELGSFGANARECAACSRRRLRNGACAWCGYPLIRRVGNRSVAPRCLPCDDRQLDPYCATCGIVLPEGRERDWLCVKCELAGVANGN